MKGSGPEQFNADPDLAKKSAFSFPRMSVWPGVQAVVTLLSLPNIFRFLMHVNPVLDFTILFWIARIAAWLSTKIMIFSFTILSMISSFATSDIAKTFAWKTVLYLPRWKKILICLRA